MALNKIGILRFLFFFQHVKSPFSFTHIRTLLLKKGLRETFFRFHTWVDRDPAVSEGTLDSRAPFQHPLLVPGQRKRPRGPLRGRVWSLPRLPGASAFPVPALTRRLLPPRGSASLGVPQLAQNTLPPGSGSARSHWRERGREFCRRAGMMFTYQNMETTACFK